VFRLTTLLQSLGARGALANVQAVLETRAREDWLVEGLLHRLGDQPATSTPVTATSTAA
jgi:hypothetical protein